jgi:hypothetical protein
MKEPWSQGCTFKPIEKESFSHALWYSPRKQYCSFALLTLGVPQSYLEKKWWPIYVQLRLRVLLHAGMFALTLTTQRHGCWSTNYWVACTWYCYKLNSFWTWWDKYFQLGFRWEGNHYLSYISTLVVDYMPSGLLFVLDVTYRCLLIWLIACFDYVIGLMAIAQCDNLIGLFKL